MPSFQDSIFLFILALLLFGPKRLPKLARELGKWVGEFRRASNEFKMQMDEELRVSEQADRQKQIATMEAAAPVAQPALDAAVLENAEAELVDGMPVQPASDAAAGATEVLPIASAGEITILPPATGLPAAQHRTGAGRADTTPAADHDALDGLLGAIPAAQEEAVTTHGD